MSAGTARIAMADGTFVPGAEIFGEVAWNLPAAPREAVLRLFWHTKGRGDRDLATVWERSFGVPLADDRRGFSLKAPDFPLSFSGKLISLIWSMELVIDGNGRALADLVIAPGGVEMNLVRPDWLVIDAPWDKPKFSGWKLG